VHWSLTSKNKRSVLNAGFRFLFLCLHSRRRDRLRKFQSVSALFAHWYSLTMSIRWASSLSAAFVLICSVNCFAQAIKVEPLPSGYRCVRGEATLDVSAFATNILRIAVEPAGIQDARTIVLDPSLQERAADGFHVEPKSNGGQLKTAAFVAVLDCSKQSLKIMDAAGKTILSVPDLWDNAARQTFTVQRAADDPMYGMTGTERNKPIASIERPQGAIVRAGAQGNGGAPFFFTKTFGVLMDSVDGRFSTRGKDVTFDHGSRRDVEAFVLIGNSMQTISALSDLTGHPPMPPRWTLGFLNSQWGSNEAELRAIVAHYRASQIPLDGFILDFDWKAWGEDDYGEWRWNSTRGAGNPQPYKFPTGASGQLGRDLLAQGVHLGGILKPRILLYKKGTKDFLEAAAYADVHHFWAPGGDTQVDYRSNSPSKNLNFAIPAERQWFWKHLEPAFDAGMTAWWPDEADEGALEGGRYGLLSSTEHFNMGRALYEGQRAYSDTRVWSINRNFYLGAQRYGYAEWSGDIKTGEASMALQPARMLATLNLGEPHWSMDTGGFEGHPTNEEYARWMEFAAFVPIFRVHGGLDEKRQPWVYGPVAEAAAVGAMKLRYSLLPYIYSAERRCYDTGIGIVRPLEWIFPDDSKAATQMDEWMFGDALLVAPVLSVHASSRKIYLPAGQWTEYTTGQVFSGKKMVELPVDNKTLADIPLFVRAGSIVATEEPGDSTDMMHPAEITLDVFPSQTAEARWSMYDDDGISYAYEKGKYFEQAIRARFDKKGASIDLLEPEGTYATPTHSYKIRIHGVDATALREGERVIAKSDLNADAGKTSWSMTKDSFGDVVEIHVVAGHEQHLLLPGAVFESGKPN
jgi:alpha-glucosidase